jgi:transcription initiation factor TFIID subunit 9B
MHYYTTEILQEAKVYKEYACYASKSAEAVKNNVDINDVKLAIASKAYSSFTRPIPVSVMKSIANERNREPL